MLPILISDLYNYLALAVMLLAILFGYRKGRDVVSVSSQPANNSRFVPIRFADFNSELPLEDECSKACERPLLDAA